MTALLIELLSHCSALTVVVVTLAVSMTAFVVLLDVVKLIKEFSVSPAEADYLAWAARRERNAAWRERYDDEHREPGADYWDYDEYVPGGSEYDDDVDDVNWRDGQGDEDKDTWF